MKIDRIKVYRLRVPLLKPYKLSFGPVIAYDTVLVEIDTGANTGIGEATYLTGYTDETIDESWSLVQQLAQDFCGRHGDEVARRLEAYYGPAP